MYDWSVTLTSLRALIAELTISLGFLCGLVTLFVWLLLLWPCIYFVIWRYVYVGLPTFYFSSFFSQYLAL